MQPRYSNISLEALDELNAFALSDSPSAAENFSRRCAELSSDSALSGLGMLRESGNLLLADLTIPGIYIYVECESLLHLPQNLQHPVEQVSACLSLMHRQELALKNTGQLEPTTIPMADVQRRLSHLLVQYPALMDHRMLIGVCAPDDDWVPVAHALAETSFGSLPRISDGLTAKQLRLFAANRHVRAGLTRVAPDTNAHSSVGGKTPQTAAFDGSAAPTAPGATRGAFLLSLLHTDRHSKEMTGRGAVNANTAERDHLYGSLSRVVWDVAFTGGKNSNVTRDELLGAMRLRSPFAKAGKAEGSDDEFDLSVATASGSGGAGRPLLLHHMALNLDHQLFMAPGDGVESKPESSLTTDEMRERTRAAIAVLVDGGVHATSAEAASWLAQSTVGVARMNAVTVGPACQPEAALGFLMALHEHGAAVSLDNAEQVIRMNSPTASPNFSPPAAGRQKRALESVENWRIALDIFSRTLAMESVFQRHAAATPAATHQPSSDAVRRARARRSV